MPVVHVQSSPAIQYGVLPFRRKRSGKVEVMLVTSLRTKRWILPKGWPVDGLIPSESAAQEAFEEAGVVGHIWPTSIGSYLYEKQNSRGRPERVCEVTVFALEVIEELGTWPEAGRRELRWLSCTNAAHLISDESAKPLIQTFANLSSRAAALSF